MHVSTSSALGVALVLRHGSTPGSILGMCSVHGPRGATGSSSNVMADRGQLLCRRRITVHSIDIRFVLDDGGCAATTTSLGEGAEPADGRARSQTGVGRVFNDHSWSSMRSRNCLQKLAKQASNTQLRRG